MEWMIDRENMVEEKESRSGNESWDIGVLLGNLQFYVLEILMRLLSLAVLEYRLTPVLKSCSLLLNESEYMFE